MLFDVLLFLNTIVSIFKSNIINMNTIKKILCINNLNVPNVLQEEIKSYAFSDYETEAKKKMTKIAKIISQFRKRFDNQESWDFCVQDGRALVQLIGSNCQVCGGYKSAGSTNFFMNLKDKLRCSCDDFIATLQSNAPILGYVYEQDTQNYVYNPQYDQYINGVMNFDQDETEIDEDQELEDWLYSESGPQGPNGYDNDSDY
jgi:hypothetical protein